MVADESTSSSAVACTHQNKSKLLNLNSVRKALKGSQFDKLTCVDCNRAVSPAKANGEKAVPSTQTAFDDLWVCVQCGHVLCGKEHLKTHYEADRSGEKHHFVFHLCTSKLRCLTCDIDLVPNDTNNDPVKKFHDEMRCFLKGKTRDPTTERNGQASTKEVIVNGTNQPLPAAPATPSTSKHNGIAKLKNGLLNQEINSAKGLMNLGNTCFYNSVMQCIMHSPPIQLYVDNVGHDVAINIPEVVTAGGKEVEVRIGKVPLPQTQAPLIKAFSKFIVEFKCQRSPNPRPLFEEIAKKVPRFRGYAQQDAHELLRYLLDGLRQEELEPVKSVILEYMGNPKKPDPEQRQLSKALLACAEPTVLDCIFGGKLVQTIACLKCKHVSTRVEPFLDLSLPIPRSSKEDGSPKVRPHNRVRKSSEGGGMSKHQRKKALKQAKKACFSLEFALNKGKFARKDSKPDNAEQNAGEIMNTDKLDEAMDEGEAEQLNASMSNMEVDDDPPQDAKTDEEESQDEAGDWSESGELSMVDYTTVLTEQTATDDERPSLESALKQFIAVDQLHEGNAYECEKCCEPWNNKKRTCQPKRLADANKRYLILSPPVVLTLHIKRFEQVHSGTRLVTRKCRDAVLFPAVLDLAPFIAKQGERLRPGQTQVLYRLYGVVSHSGDMGGGHYIAYVRSPRPSHVLHAFFKEAFDSRTNLTKQMKEAAQNGLIHEDDKDPNESESEDPQPSTKWFYASDSHINVVTEEHVLKAEAYLLFYERIL